MDRSSYEFSEFNVNACNLTGHKTLVFPLDNDGVEDVKKNAETGIKSLKFICAAAYKNPNDMDSKLARLAAKKLVQGSGERYSSCAR